MPKQFKMNAHKKIADRLSGYCGNITRRAEAEGKNGVGGTAVSKPDFQFTV